ncbi:MAG TPA: ABC-F family ATP-binding cassette domain-containing protein [Bacteroidota bacterium]|nr:ABC-F family ATP-binding cassette domain-containing protein [Bacteroidota bacterium]
MIAAVGLRLQFGDRVLFKEIGFRIGPHDRIGLVGANGTGKTTLLRMLVGAMSPDSGTVAKAKYVSVGYLPQEGMAAAGRTLYAEAESVFAGVIETQAALDEVHRRMGELGHESPEFAELLEVYGELQHRLEASDAFRIRTGIEKVLAGLGFSPADMERQTEEFSGGWQMRIALAKLLLAQPSLLLLDEPTNHLDLDSLRWLEDYLRAYEGAVMIVSHDRRFLDNMTAKTYELSLGALTEYAGNYAFYVREKAARKEQQLAAWRNQQQQIKQTEQFIERFRYKATKARQVQSRIKQLEKMDLIEIEDEEGGIHFAFPAAPPSGRVVMELKGVDKSYGALRVFNGVSLDIDRGDRIAFVGVNGAGKSTMARIIAGVEPIDGGERRVGHNVTIAYFAQHQAEELNGAADVLQTVDEVATGDIRRRLRTLLGCFLFSGDDVFKKVRVLSGGEKSRLALAKMLLVPSNLIVLDEPTNHLDMRSKGVLQEALGAYEGSFVIVSHDRDFLDPLVTKVVEFRRGLVTVYPGNVSEYIESRERRERAAAEQEKAALAAAHPGRGAAGPAGSFKTPGKERKRLEAEERQRRYRKTKPLRDEIAALEASLEALEEEKAALEQQMADPGFYRDGEHARTAQGRYREIEQALSDGYFRWNELTKKLQELEAAGEGR